MENNESPYSYRMNLMVSDTINDAFTTIQKMDSKYSGFRILLWPFRKFLEDGNDLLCYEHARKFLNKQREKAWLEATRNYYVRR